MIVLFALIIVPFCLNFQLKFKQFFAAKTFFYIALVEYECYCLYEKIDQGKQHIHIRVYGAAILQPDSYSVSSILSCY